MTQPEDNSDLPQDVETLKQLVHQLTHALEEKSCEVQRLEAAIDRLIRQFRGPSSERHVDPNQPLLFPVGSDDDDPDPDPPAPSGEETPAQKKKRRRGRRAALGENLKRHRREHLLADDQTSCSKCGEQLFIQWIKGAEQYGYSPGHYFVTDHFHQTGFCNGCDECVEKAAKPPEMAPKSLADASMLAHVIVNKFGDHIPSYRQEEVGLRGGVWLPRSTLCDWHKQAAWTSTLLYCWLSHRVLQGKVIGTDETKAPVLDPGAGKTHNGRMWIYCGQLEVCPYLIYQYTRTKEGRHARQFLQGFQGYLQADAASTFDQLYVDELIWEVGCAAHMRRYFYNARHEDSKRANIALAYFRRLYMLERELKEDPPDARHARRRAEAFPILEALKKRLDQWAGRVLPASEFGKAVQYALNHWEALLRYCDEGWLIIDNTRSERALRTIAVGRRNWLFYGSDGGGKTGAILTTLVQSAKSNRVSPYPYLVDVFERLPMVREHDALLPVLRSACERITFEDGARLTREQLDQLATPLDHLRLLKDYPRALTEIFLSADLPAEIVSELDALKPDLWHNAHPEHHLPLNRRTRLVGDPQAA